jgi:hypothetical protein
MPLQMIQTQDKHVIFHINPHSIDYQINFIIKDKTITVQHKN